MTEKFNEKLIEILKTDSRFVDDEGELVKAAVIDRAWKIDRDLVKLLLADPDIKGKFFDEIEKHWIFNINTFIEYISDKNFLANSYTRFRNKIGLNIGGKFLRERGEVSLVWPYKDCVLEGGQTREEEKRKEIFFNEILAQDEIDRLFDPKVLTNWKRYTVDGEQNVAEIKRDETGTIKENLIIKGNNLLALHTLKKQFRGRVKLIYIDPPYNTGGDSFRYNDNFNHSTWLTFMKNRLEVAREIITKEGTIAISIDQNEIAYLMNLLDEIFGKENRKNIITIKRGSVTGAKVINPGVVNISEFVIIYSRDFRYWNPNRVYMPKERDVRYNGFIQNFEDGYENWTFTTVLEAFAEELKIKKTRLKKHFGDDYERELELFIYKNSEQVMQFASLDENSVSQEAVKIKKQSENEKDRVFFYEREGKRPYYIYKGKLILFAKNSMTEVDGKKTFAQPTTDIWNDVLPNDLHNEGGIQLRKGKKPEKLISRIIELWSDEGEIILDFFVGSGTTAAVALKLNRQFIGIEQLDYIEELPAVRLQNTIAGEKSGISKEINWKGGGDFIYCELMKYNEAFMDKIQAAKTSKELVKLWKNIAKNSFLNWYVNPEMPEDAINNFIEIGKTENGLEKQKKLLAELLNKNQLYVNLSEIDDKQFNVSDYDKDLNRKFYGEA
ncbi:MAG: site-specific DNA-methyltransferase [Proteobacteria bacterium]|nr:site-specific DNA-methyltransferase [Desulfobacteraceae bacterium]MBU4011980.1 site-specific DNA-methyltransferase [Pseudomonadota bacterium]MBU4069124.1 site-specific DNA-methyltransferase [Pseudomonadota bacterium]MBU4127818.1 site-specific DNA-methyltransferase [Pseudomonadota bacterium]MCG2758162.1 site-specific DNA-methyltransferase [Desulfobacteraceae bacterium]